MPEEKQKISFSCGDYSMQLPVSETSANILQLAVRELAKVPVPVADRSTAVPELKTKTTDYLKKSMQSSENVPKEITRKIKKQLKRRKRVTVSNEDLLAYIKGRESVRAADVSKHFGMSDSGATNKLIALHDDGVVEKVGWGVYALVRGQKVKPAEPEDNEELSDDTDDKEFLDAGLGKEKSVAPTDEQSLDSFIERHEGKDFAREDLLEFCQENGIEEIKAITYFKKLEESGRLVRKEDGTFFVPVSPVEAPIISKSTVSHSPISPPVYHVCECCGLQAAEHPSLRCKKCVWQNRPADYKAAVQYVKDRPHEPLSVDELSKRFNLLRGAAKKILQTFYSTNRAVRVRDGVYKTFPAMQIIGG